MQMLPANAEGSVLLSLLLIPLVYGEWRRALSCGSCQSRSLGAAAQTRNCSRGAFPQGSPGCEQMEQPARDLAASSAHTWGAERKRTLCISQAECLVPQRMQIHPPPCSMCRAEQSPLHLWPLQ